MKKITFFLLFYLYCFLLFSQTAPEITGKSLTLPRLSTAQRDASNSIEGQIIYNTTTKQLEYFNGSYWFYVWSYQNPYLSGLNSLNVKLNVSSSIEFTLAIDSKLTASYQATGTNITIANPSGSVSANKLVINFTGTAVGAGNLTLTVTDSQGKVITQNVNISIFQQELTKSYVETTLTSAYQSLLGWTNSWSPFTISPSNWLFNLATDEFHKGSDPGDLVEWSQIENFQWLPTMTALGDKWTASYEGVKRANEVIRSVRGYLALNPAEAAYAKQIEAEATFLRAYYHFDLYKIFKNIPYYKEFDTFYQVPSSGSATVLLAIIADLEKSASDLLDQKMAANRIDKYVAISFLAKAKLYKADYQGALTAFNQVINSGRYSLNLDFHDNFKEDSNYSSESILQATVNFGAPSATGFLRGDRLALPYGTSPSQCCGFMNAPYDLAYAYRTDANGLPISTSNVSLSRILAGSNMPLDPRIDWTMGRTNVPFLDWGLHKDDWMRNAAFAGYYSAKKNTIATLGGTRVNEFLTNLNYNLMRYADLLLMAAECEVQVGSLERARTYVNQIRARAGNTAQGSSSISVPMNSSQITWATYRVGQYTQTWTDKTTSYDAVKLERHLELAMEGHRLFDLQRWGDLEKVMYPYIQREKQLASASLNVSYPNSKNYAFPIPQAEIDKSNGNIRQNPGF